MAINKYWVGSKIFLTGEFRDQANVLVNVDSASVLIISPTGARTTATPSSVSTGVYRYQYEIVSAGEHKYAFTGIKGTDKGVTRNTFIAESVS